MEIATQGGVHIPRLVTDGMLEVGAISRIIARLSSFRFAGPGLINMQKLLMALVAVSLIKPLSLICDSTFVCRQKFCSLPWRFTLWVRQILPQVKVYWTPLKFNPEDSPTHGIPSGWTAYTCTLLRKPLKLPQKQKSAYHQRPKDNLVLVQKFLKINNN